MLGGFLQGVTVKNRFADGPFDWLTPFCLFAGPGLWPVTPSWAHAG
jgi:hypothetical protein